MTLFARRRRVAFMPQMEMAECGAASLAMILGYHGHHASLPEVRQACGVARDGASALALLRAARSYNLEAEAVRVELEDLDSLPLPAIIHWDFNHFLVLERLKGRTATLVDPALGRRKADMSELHTRFTGVALVFAPGDDFEPRKRKRPSLSRYKVLLKEAWPSLSQVLGASLMLQIVGLIFPVANQLLVDRVIVPRQEPWLWGLAAALTLTVLGTTLLRVLRSWIVQGLQVSLDQRLMGQFVSHLLKLPLSFFLQRQAGDLLQRVQSNTAIRNLFTTRSVSALLDSFTLLGFAALMLAYDPLLGGTVIVLAVLRVAVMMLLRDRSLQSMAAEMAASGKESSALVESLTALETLKASKAEDRMIQRWTDRMVERVNRGLDRRRMEIASGQVMTLLQGTTLAVILWIGGRGVLSERLTLGVFTSFLALQGMFMTPLESMMDSIGQLQYLGTYLHRLDDVLETAPEPSGTLDPGRLAGAIELEDVRFGYAPGAEPTIRDVSLRIQPGEKIALVGPSGAGKSTLARLLLGMHLPSAGSIRFDGHDLKEMDLVRFRRQVGVVLQETFLLDDTVRANLSLNDPALPLDRIVEAAKLACIHDVIEALPQGYETKLGENGSRFSGGQRQRLALARALAHGPALLLLDEATSALDLELEAKLHANLASLRCTRIVIAHRLATVRDADRIFVIQDGQVHQEGPFDHLYAQSGLFRDLVHAMEQSHA